MPSRSSAISSDSASTPSKLMLVVFGTRGSRAPLTAVPGTRAEHALLEPIAQLREARGVGGQLLRRQARRHAEPDDCRDVLRAGAAVPLVLAAGHVRASAACRA